MFGWLRRRPAAAEQTPPGGTPAARPGQGSTGLRAPSTPEEKRFASVYAEDRVGPMPYPNQATPDVAAARGRVRSLVNDLLPNAVDEGTGAALDPLVASWASGWLARVDSEHADHHAVIDRLVGGARQQLADAEATHERDRRALEVARLDYADARERLMEPAGPRRGTGPDPDAPTAAVPPTPNGSSDPRRSAARGPRAARQALSVRTPPGPPDDALTGPLRATDRPATGRPADEAVTEQETR
ncbi:hypothetical protein [Actinomycetospora atypica]|uniref:Uncharacterized protein n=1 Tax=Actinomycetospora atypica TaxID=1290095 RepID=A0ABV9YW00_9PSEU